MNNLLDVDFNCCGCSTCAHSCPKKAISMIQNGEGFKEFFIDKNKCINCGLCLKKCPQLNDVKNVSNDKKTLKCYAAYINETLKIKKSASGGIFQAIAYAFSKKNDFAIIGCKYDENYKAVHYCVEDISEIDCLLSSKYVQSDVNNIYCITKQKLDDNKTVLFSGTPCQIAGLYSYLSPKKYEKLYTIDIICHGVPSPLLFEKYINYIQKKYKGHLSYYNFRSKDLNTWDDRFKYIVGNKICSGNYYFDAYYYNFIKGNDFRECCYNCKYSKKDRISDMTIGDYWGIEDVHPDMNNNLGVSAVIINTTKGDYMFNLIKNDIKFCKSSFEKMSKHNHNLVSPTIRPKIRDVIYNGLKEKDYSELRRSNLNYKIPIRVRISKKCPIIIKRILIKLFKRK